VDPLDEHVLQQAVRLVGVRVVVTLPNVSDFLKGAVAHHFPGFSKRLERIFGLTRHRDVANEPGVVARASGVSKIMHDFRGCSSSSCSDPGVGTELRLVLLEHALMFAHVRNVMRAKIPEAGIVGLCLVVFERAKKGRVLSHGAIHLAFEKGVPALHHRLQISIVDQV